ncbi:plasminogen activator%2C urokinase a [Scomber scombrus]|uniref:trypsin n=1 Tax=Scomber scombrus TaxID=13677 RepID=A0AAV1MWW6_SCOSC
MNLLVILTLLGVFNINVAFSRRRSKERSSSPQVIHKETCLSGNGSSYRGTVSKSASGRRCLNWSRFENLWGIGDHSYCRNPDQRLKPWCYVRKNRRVAKDYCDIPKFKPPPSTTSIKPPPAVDTELTCGEKSERKMNKIVGGSFTRIESHPWVASIFNKGGFLCGGSLIAPCWVLSAAHCFSDGEGTNIKHLSVYLGKRAINETDDIREQNFTVEKLIVHQKYNENNFNNDIALLKIRSRDGRCAVQSPSARIVCLPPSHTRLPAGFHCSIAGYGKERVGAWRYSQILKQAEVNLISQTDCRSKSIHHRNLLTENMFCAGSPDWSTDACKGDSGGPLVCEASGRMFLFGVVSWGVGCAEKNKPGVYTQVSNYNQWIADITQLPEYTAGKLYPTK